MHRNHTTENDPSDQEVSMKNSMNICTLNVQWILEPLIGLYRHFSDVRNSACFGCFSSFTTNSVKKVWTPVFFR
ncbi:unnamed protein product [Trichobilharzia szidati]|nr:unnamed protein product [Trichobilharzia szidati]